MLALTFVRNLEMVSTNTAVFYRFSLQRCSSVPVLTLLTTLFFHLKTLQAFVVGVKWYFSDLLIFLFKCSIIWNNFSFA